MQERCIALISFNNQIITRTQLSIGTQVVEHAANNKRRVQTRLGHQRRNQTGGRCFPVCPCHSNTEAIAHELSQHLRSRDNRYSLLSGGFNFRIGLVDSGRHHEHIRAIDIGGPVSNRNFNS